MSCGCQKPQGGLPGQVSIGGVTYVRVDVPEVALEQTKIETTKLRTGPGQLVMGGVSREPLLAVSESVAMEGVDQPVEECNVYGCGECCEPSGPPSAVRFDRYKKNPLEAVYECEPGKAHPLPPKLARIYKESPSCIPFVSVSRDPATFRNCLAMARRIGPITDAKKVFELLGEFLCRQDQEVFLVLLLDSQLQVRGVSEIARGGRDAVTVPVPDVLRIAIVDGASAIVVVHNHPSGVLKPSESDKLLTESLKKAAKEVHLRLFDHVIVGATGFYSFASHHLL